MADWSTPQSLPSDHATIIYKVLLCQARPWRAPETAHPECRPMLYAMGIQAQTGYIQPDASRDGDFPLGSGDWYQLSPKWDQRLWMQFRYRTPWVDETAIFRSPDVDKLIQEVADWSQESAPPRSYRRTARFLFCQQDQDVMVAPPPRMESCHLVMYARGSIWKPGSIRFADADESETKGSSGSWFPLTPKWDSLLDARLRRWEYLSSLASMPTSESTATPFSYPFTYEVPQRICSAGGELVRCE